MKKRGIILAWLVGTGIVVYRAAWPQKRPPYPSELVLTSIVFITLSVIAEIEALATPAVIAAWGFDIAAYLRLVDPTEFGLPGKTPAASTPTPVVTGVPSAGGTTGVGPAK